MASNTKRRQKKLEAKEAKRKAKRNSLARRSTGGIVERLAAAPNAPFQDCFLLDQFDQGMGSVIVSRKLPDRSIASASFLVDAYCLGIKDSFARIVSPDAYAESISNRRERLDDIAPADARRLIEDAAAYGRSIGFPPRGEFRKSMSIFQGVDSAEATRRFDFGHRGKPHFINGPHDSQEDIDRIINTLEEHCGRGEYNVTFLGDGFSMW